MRSRIFELLAAATVVATWLLAARSLGTLPARIPTHFGLNGEADAFGPAASLFVLPIVTTVMYAALGGVTLIPQRRWNYPVRVTERNRSAVYALGREMLPVLKLCTMVTLLAVEVGVIEAAARGSLRGNFALLVFARTGFLFGVIVYYTLRMRAA